MLTEENKSRRAVEVNGTFLPM